MLPLFIQMRVNKNDFLYGQGDQAEEIFFIFKGRVKFKYDVHFMNPERPALAKPINISVKGSYFGDIEVLLN